MANFDEHVNEAKENLRVLQQFNSLTPASWKWQVTISFYVAVHLMGAHLVKKVGMSYDTHKDTLQGLNPSNMLSVARVPRETYLAYEKLMNLSRKTRYSCVRDSNKHFKRAIEELDKIITFFQVEYASQVSFEKYRLKGLESYEESLNFFEKV